MEIQSGKLEFITKPLEKPVWHMGYKRSRETLEKRLGKALETKSREALGEKYGRLLARPRRIIEAG